MRSTFPALRARGASVGRSPQIGPGTFIGYTGSSETEQPGRFTAIVHAGGTGVAEAEWWCFRTGGSQLKTYRTISESGGNGDRFLWLDQIPDGASFQPPSDPAGMASALKQYAVDRYYAKYGELTQTSNWEVRESRRSSSPSVLSSVRKIADGVYRVFQIGYPINEQLKAWVAVTGSGGHEIWLYYRPDQVDGFLFVGLPHPSTGQLNVSTRLQFELAPAAPAFNITQYATSIAAFKHYATTVDVLRPTNDPSQLVDHHHRVVAP